LIQRKRGLRIAIESTRLPRGGRIGEQRVDGDDVDFVLAQALFDAIDLRARHRSSRASRNACVLLEAARVVALSAFANATSPTRCKPARASSRSESIAKADAYNSRAPVPSAQ
jgi:hypothetical protein